MNRTVKEAIEEGSRQLRTAGVDNPILDTEVLLCHVLNQDRAWLLSHDQDVVLPEQQKTYEALVQARAQHTPVAYIIGHKEFFGHEFVVNQDVLIPRPDTEILVESVLEELTLLQPHYKHLCLIDIGTGSGCILLSLLEAIQGVKAVGIDISQDALRVAQKNHQNLCPDTTIDWRQGNLLEPYKEWDTNCVYLITANLPYIDPVTTTELSSDILDYEPHHALFAEEQGSALIKGLVAQVKTLSAQGIRFVVHLEGAPYNIPLVQETLPKDWEQGTYQNLADQTLFLRFSTFHP